MTEIIDLISFSEPDEEYQAAFDSQFLNQVQTMLKTSQDVQRDKTEINEQVQHDDDTQIQEEIQSGEFKEAETSELLGKVFNSEEEAYKCYCAYAYRKCFGIRKDSLRKGAKNNVLGRHMVCTKGRTKTNKGSLGKEYTKLDRRTHCKAGVYFKVVDGKYVCQRHDMIHNHEFCHPNEVHTLRCHREVESEEVQYLLHLRSSGVRLADAVKCMAKEAGGSPALGFTYADAQAAVNKAKSIRFDVTDCNSFIKLLKQRAASEEDFYYDFELDEDNALISFFFRDKKMREDYEAFPELLGNDGTYCTNKYGLVCAPLVGINHHTRICMFGVGFMLTERTQSYTWLYTTFLASMGGIQPKTIMTDQSAAMASAIKTCFPNSKHRLCIWHIFKNSTAHLGSLKNKEGFQKLFSRMLKRCHTDEELEYCWGRMKREFGAEKNTWLLNLYEIRAKWCCAYGKEYFSAGVMSSQRSESTNHAISKRLTKTTDLCDFYDIFGGVVSDWRSKERNDNALCWDGVPEVLIPCSMLESAAKVYTIGAFKCFEKEFVKSMSYTHRLQTRLDHTECYLVSTTSSDEFGHFVTYDSLLHLASCSCKKFEESGFLCRHILRVYHVNSVTEVPSVYLLKRWSKDAKPKDDITEGLRGKIAGPVWKLDMHRKFHKLIIASVNNEKARAIVNESFNRTRSEIQAVLGGIDCSDDEGHDQNNSADVIQNPKSNTKKGEKFKRKRSIIDVQTSRTKAKFKAAETRARKQTATNDGDGSGGTSNNFNMRHMGLRQIIMNN